jgi:hypothetical protein
MKILFVSGCAPAIFNTGEPNSYPYYIIKELAKENHLFVLYFNTNKRLAPETIGKGLAMARVDDHHELKSSPFGKIFTYGYYAAPILLTKLFLSFGLNPPQFLVPIPLSSYKKKPPVTLSRVVKEFNPELVIFFPQLLQFAVRQVTKLEVPVSLLCTDSGVLHFARLMEVKGPNAPDRKKNYQQLIQFQKLEANYGKINAKYFFVGQKDKETFFTNSNSRARCFFIPHHLYSYSSHSKNWENIGEPLNIVFAGGGHTIYTGDEADRIAAQIATSQDLSPRLIKFFFLGGGYERAIRTLLEAGYSVTHSEWVDNYDDFMSTKQVQVFPIIMGTGTKAKVLSAMSSELLCIGTWYSFENILANPDEHYLQYSDPGEIPGLLFSICQNRTKYAAIAVKGKMRIVEMHNTGKVVKQLLSDSRDNQDKIL